MRRGITLLEVLIIIALVTIVLVTAIPGLGYSRERARRESCAQNMNAIHKAITMYETDFSSFPTRFRSSPWEGDSQEALNLLYRAYTDDVRIFSCPSRPISPTLLNSVLPCTAPGWPGSGGTSFQQSAPGATSGFSTSYGYSPGHTSVHPRVIILADHQSNGPDGNSDNHGRDAGQNVLSAGGTVEFRSGKNARANSLGMGSKGEPIVDSDIFTFNTITPNTYVDWDSECR